MTSGHVLLSLLSGWGLSCGAGSTLETSVVSSSAEAAATEAPAASNAPFAELALGNRVGCARRVDGAVACWTADEPTLRPTGVSDATAIAVYDATPCAVRRSGAVWCEDGNVPPELGEVRALASNGGRGRCAVLGSGDVVCWDSLASWVERTYPARTTTMDMWEGERCGIADGRVWCRNVDRYHVDPYELRPNPITEVPGDAVDVAVGPGFVCSSHRDGRVWCWGSGEPIRVLTGNETSRQPVVVPEVVDAVEIVASYETVCARLRGDALMCWGGNDEGQIARDAPDAVGPRRIDVLPRVTSVAMLGHLCATDAASVRCWGGERPSALEGEGASWEVRTPEASRTE
ncbi:MAG: hypothetical protein JJ863_23445 [Deltaproteobacteria bacterium]|nr:hypothetical protein [Deltaproteobacteria bacterium]